VIAGFLSIAFESSLALKSRKERTGARKETINVARGSAADWSYCSLCYHFFGNQSYCVMGDSASDLVHGRRHAWYGVVIPSLGLLDGRPAQCSHKDLDVLLSSKEVSCREVRWSDCPSSVGRRDQWD
jgi:hypothetical protein